MTNINIQDKDENVLTDSGIIKPESNVAQVIPHDPFFDEGPDSSGLIEDFDGIPRMADRARGTSAASRSQETPDVVFHVYRQRDSCASPNANIYRSDDIPSHPPGNCLFFSLIKTMGLNLSALELRKQLLKCDAIKLCGSPSETREILSSQTMYGNVDCAFIFACEYKRNICIHFELPTKQIIYCHIIVNDTSQFSHLHLTGVHFTPYLEAPTQSNLLDSADAGTEPSDRGYDNNNANDSSGIHHRSQVNHTEVNEDIVSSHNSVGSEEPTDNANTNHQHDLQSIDTGTRDTQSTQQLQTKGEARATSRAHNDVLERYLVSRARPPREKPPWAIPDGEDPMPFTHIRALNEHPFRFKENLIYLVTADGFHTTEILEALTEREYINRHELVSKQLSVGEINIAECKGMKMIGICVKNHIDDRPLISDVRKCLTTLKNLARQKNIHSFAVVRDLSILSLSEWSSFVAEFNKIFSGIPLVAVLFNNNLPVPPVEDRYKIIQEYHTAPIGGHRGINKTYSKLANDYYWKNMRPDVRQFVLRCATCQTNKLVRVKTRLPLVISNTPSLPFEQISLDFYGPLQQSAEGHRYILTAQDWLTKYIILTPVEFANAEEVARALTEKIICYFGPPAAIITDQGTHFRNKLLAEFSKLFKINKYSTTAYHPQSNGGIERMHHTLTEYLRKYVDNSEEWHKWTAMCQHAYNCTEHESTGYTPHELLFGQRARTPSSFPDKNQSVTYNDYVVDMTSKLTQLQTMAAMNLVQSKYRSKYYYDRKLNIKHFREGELVYLLKQPKKGKFAVEYEGPYEILEINHQFNNVKIGNNQATKTVHVDKIKRAFSLEIDDEEDDSPQQQKT